MIKMSIIESAILGIIQGLTEFIPVSSSGHLVIAQFFFSGASDHLFVQWIDLGTFLALLIYFRTRIKQIIVDVTVGKNYLLARNILITALPVGAVGLLFNKFIESASFFGSIVTVLTMLALVGVIMIITERLPHLSAIKGGQQLSWRRALVIGCVQIFALIPGVSRSGSTIIGGRLMGLSAAAAAEFSFLVSLPIMFGLIMKLILSSEGRQYFVQHMDVIIVSNVFAFVAGIIAVSYVLRYLAKHGLAVFGWYRVGLVSVIVIFLLLQSIIR